MNEKLAFARKLVKTLSNMEVECYTDAELLLQNVEQNSLYRSSSAAEQEMLRRFFYRMEPGCVYELAGMLDMQFVILRSLDRGTYLCIGPCLLNELTETQLRQKLSGYFSEQEALQNAAFSMRWLPVVPYERLYQLSHLLGQHFFGLPQEAPHRRVAYRRDGAEREQTGTSGFGEEQYRIQQVEKRYEEANVILEAVKQGNHSLAFQIVQNMMPNMTPMVRNPNPLRNTQNICIILNTQLRHAMEELHIHPYALDQFSTDIARQIENLKTPEAAGRYILEIIRRYCDLALENTHPDINHLAREAVLYIKNHLSDNLTVKDAAKALLTNANYLSGVFHREVGMTFIDFVNQERVRQAASLLRRTELQIQQVATLVGYNNSSYFARQFVRLVGMTPSEYRRSPV